MLIGVAGVSHHHAPVRIRERFVLSDAAVLDALAHIAEEPCVLESMLLSTCNRTELYVAGDADAVEFARRFLIARAGVAPDEATYVYTRQGRAAAEHLFRVAAGLDSMILGEAQIQGQVRNAYDLAQRAATAGTILSRLAERVLSAGALVRTETGLGKRAGSVATAVMDVSRKVFGSLRERNVVVVGAGEMSELVLEAMVSAGAKSTVVSSRGEERARGLAERLGIPAARFEELPALLAGAQILVSATAAPHSVIQRDLVERAMRARDEPLLLFDLALPRDVEPAAREIGGVFLYDMDDLQQVVERRESWWRGEVQRAEQLLQACLEDFDAWYRSRSAVPLIRELRDRVEDIRAAELERALRRLRHLSDADRAVVERLASQLASKILHTPMVRLREAARAEDDGQALLAAARFLFHLRGEEVTETVWDEETDIA